MTKRDPQLSVINVRLRIINLLRAKKIIQKKQYQKMWQEIFIDLGDLA